MNGGKCSRTERQTHRERNEDTERGKAEIKQKKKKQ
jgi:hypothetical protein